MAPGSCVNKERKGGEDSPGTKTTNDVVVHCLPRRCQRRGTMLILGGGWLFCVVVGDGGG